MTTSITVFAIVFSALAGLFSFWSTSKKDGFDQEKIFDLLFFGFLGGSVLSTAVSMFTKRAFVFGISGLNPFAYLFGFLGVVCLVVLKWKWSLYRVLDNLAVSITLSAGFWLLVKILVSDIKPMYLLIAALIFVAYYFLQKYHLLVIKSGFTFCIVSAVFSAAGALSTPVPEHLIFLALLFTLTLVVLIFRLKALHVGHKKNRGSSNAS